MIFIADLYIKTLNKYIVLLDEDDLFILISKCLILNRKKMTQITKLYFPLAIGAFPDLVE